MQHHRCCRTRGRIAGVHQAYGFPLDEQQGIGTDFRLIEQLFFLCAEPGSLNTGLQTLRSQFRTGTLVIERHQTPVDILIILGPRAPAFADVEYFLISLAVDRIAALHVATNRPRHVIGKVPKLIGQKKRFQADGVGAVDFLFGKHIKNESAQKYGKGEQAQDQCSPESTGRVSVHAVFQANILICFVLSIL